ncbi:MAG: hypothetical protein GKS03_10945 [Alphaproteobacteria bacterium]|nr:hypothetical protein [Alphaproteobacteria bacterium]
MSEALNSLLPEYEFTEHHTTVVLGTPEQVFASVEAMDLSDSRIARTLMRLWRIPAKLVMKNVSDRNMSVDDFLPLICTPPTDLVRGLIGGSNSPKDKATVDAAAFRAFNQPGCIKLAWAFWLTDLGDNRVRVDTETRVLCTDKKTLRGFTVYWYIIRPWSGLIRLRLLASIKRHTETGSKA